MNEYITKVFLQHVERRLKSVFGDKFNDFKLLLDETGAVVSGSIIVQAILGEDWNNSDVDVYIPATNLKSPSGNPTSKIDEWMLNLGSDMISYDATNRYGDVMSRGQCITWIRNFEPRVMNTEIRRVQLIHTHLNREELPAYIYHNFDFEICKNIYSAKGGQGLLSIANIESISKKEFDFAYAGNLFGSLNRAKKYSDRGFKIKIDRSRVVNDIKAFQNAEKNVESCRKKSHFYVRFCTKDISKYDRRVYQSFTKQIQDYDIDESNLVDSVTAETSKTSTFDVANPPLSQKETNLKNESEEMNKKRKREEEELGQNNRAKYEEKSLNELISCVYEKEKEEYAEEEQKKEEEEEEKEEKKSKNKKNFVTFCEEDCFMSILGLKHFHIKGKHLGHGACEDLIVANE